MEKEYTLKIDVSNVDGLKSLSLQDFTSLEVLSEYGDTEALYLRHFPKAVGLDLTPLANLKELKVLSLSTIPGWDGSGKTLSVDSFVPLIALKCLRDFSVLDVIPLKDGVDPLTKLETLEIISLARKYYQLEHFAKIKASLPHVKGLEPIKQMSFRADCKKCNTYPKLHLEGAKPKTQSYVCPKCNIKAINKHLLRWQEAQGIPSYEEHINATPEALLQKFGNPKYI